MLLAPVAGATAAPPAFATQSELRWLVELGRTNARLQDAFDAAATIAQTPPLARKLAHDAALRRRLSRSLAAADLACVRLARVGRAPTPRMRNGLRLLGRECSVVQRAAESMTAHPTGRLFRIRRALDRAYAISARADVVLLPGLERPLRRTASTSRVSRIDDRFSHAATRIAGKAVTVRCRYGRDWRRLAAEEAALAGHPGRSAAAFASIGGATANMSPTICDALVQVAYRHAVPRGLRARFVTAYAILTLAHEPQHLRGIASEAVAQCYGMQRVVDVGMMLGLARRDARALAALLWENRDVVSPRRYRTPFCRDGGALDLHPRTRVWP